MTKEDRKIAGYMLGSGTYGNLDNHVRNEINRQKEVVDGDIRSAKKRYLRERIWVDEETMRNYFPFFYRHRSLRIILPLYRMIKGLIVHPKRLWNEAKSVRKSR